MCSSDLRAIFYFLIISIMSGNQLDKANETATLGGGCFWCVEAVFQRVDGVIDVKPGYAGGHVKNPTYKEICTGNTGHAEEIGRASCRERV